MMKLVEKKEGIIHEEETSHCSGYLYPCHVCLDFPGGGADRRAGNQRNEHPGPLGDGGIDSCGVDDHFHCTEAGQDGTAVGRGGAAEAHPCGQGAQCVESVYLCCCTGDSGAAGATGHPSPGTQQRGTAVPGQGHREHLLGFGYGGDCGQCVGASTLPAALSADGCQADVGIYLIPPGAGKPDGGGKAAAAV